MLVLTRSVGTSVMIGEHVEVRVIAIEGGQVRLGLVAPPDIKIMRKELGPWRPEPPKQ